MADYNSVHKDKCLTEFLMLKNCYIVRFPSSSWCKLLIVCRLLPRGSHDEWKWKAVKYKTPQVGCERENVQKCIIETSVYPGDGDYLIIPNKVDNTQGQVSTYLVNSSLLRS